MNSTEHERPTDADPVDGQPSNADERDMHEMDDHAHGREDEADPDHGSDAVIAQLIEERDAAIGAKLRAQADFVNYQRRSVENEQRALASGMHAVVRSLLPALDNLDRALESDPGRTTVEQIRDGVRMVRGEIARALESHGITAIVPSPGDEFDPRRHEALMRQPAEGIDPDHVVTVLQVGYAMGDAILRPAKVTLAQADQ